MLAVGCCCKLRPCALAGSWLGTSKLAWACDGAGPPPSRLPPACRRRTATWQLASWLGSRLATSLAGVPALDRRLAASRLPSRLPALWAPRPLVAHRPPPPPDGVPPSCRTTMGLRATPPPTLVSWCRC